MNGATTFLICTLALATAQLNNYPMWGGTGGMPGMGGMTGMSGMTGMGGMTAIGTGGMNSPYIASLPWRTQGTPIPWMNPQMSNLASMGMWRSHPLIRMTSAATASAPGTGTGGTHATTIAGSVVPTSSEKMPIMTMPQNIINVPKVPSSEEILTHMMLSNQHPKHYVDTISDMFYNSDVTKTRAIANPIYMGGIDATKTAPNVMEDCSPQDAARWNRDLSEWVY